MAGKKTIRRVIKRGKINQFIEGLTTTKTL